MYATYEYYKSTFGGSLAEDVFTKAEAKAEAHIRYLTYVNGDIFATEVDSIKQAVCTAAEVIYNNEKAASAAGGTAAGIKSESNDGYSVSYVTEQTDGQTAEEALRRKISEAVKIYLMPLGWLSRRIRMGGCCDDCADEDNTL